MIYWLQISANTRALAHIEMRQNATRGVGRRRLFGDMFGTFDMGMRGDKDGPCGRGAVATRDTRNVCVHTHCSVFECGLIRRPRGTRQYATRRRLSIRPFAELRKQ